MSREAHLLHVLRDPRLSHLDIENIQDEVLDLLHPTGLVFVRAQEHKASQNIKLIA